MRHLTRLILLIVFSIAVAAGGCVEPAEASPTKPKPSAPVHNSGPSGCRVIHTSRTVAANCSTSAVGSHYQTVAQCRNQITNGLVFRYGPRRPQGDWWGSTVECTWAEVVHWHNIILSYG